MNTEQAAHLANISTFGLNIYIYTVHILPSWDTKANVFIISCFIYLIAKEGNAAPPLVMQVLREREYTAPTQS
jgi:hypothetical protein